MTREIKFRAWDDDHMLYPDDDDTDYVWLYGKDGFSIEYYDSSQAKISGGEVVEFEGYVKLDVIFQQFTGLKDKNGVEIYEGDIVNSVYFSNSLVNMNDGIWMAQDTMLNQQYEGVYDDNEWEVIGNIYENPELLEA